MRKAVSVVLKQDGWRVLFVVLLVAISEYWREGQICIGGLFTATLVASAVLLIVKVQNEIRKLEATRELL